MDGFRVVLTDAPQHDDVALLDERLYEYNVQRTGRADGRELALFLRDAAGTIAAGLYGWTWAGGLEVRTLWVREDLRGQGHGRALLLAAEEEARRRGCHAVRLDSYDFQAPGFYTQLGYREYAVLEGMPDGHRNHYLYKEFA